MTRDYVAIAQEIERLVDAESDRAHRMQTVVDRLWHHLHSRGVSWVGFYLAASDNREMVLGPSRNKPACSPIGLHGACGQAYLAGRPLVVRDVKELGENYVACDPRDQSEVVIPFYGDGSPYAHGVLDLDSFEIGAFDESDVRGLEHVLAAAGLRARP